MDRTAKAIEIEDIEARVPGKPFHHLEVRSGLGSWDNRVWRTQRSFCCVLASSICLGRTHQLIDSVLNLLFRCPHKRITRPITPVSKTGVRDGDTYVVCLECGKQFTYDLNEMRIGKPGAISP